jgi:hypothetical protein
MRTKVNEFEFKVQVNHSSMVSTAKNQDSKENVWKSNNFSNSNDQFKSQGFNDHSNKRVSGFTLGKNKYLLKIK